MPKKAKPKRGRPITGAERKRKLTVMIEPSVAQQLRRLGGDNLSRGIARAAVTASASKITPEQGALIDFIAELAFEKFKRDAGVAAAPIEKKGARS
jgi:hypothetical protein